MSFSNRHNFYRPQRFTILDTIHEDCVDKQAEITVNLLQSALYSHNAERVQTCIETLYRQAKTQQITKEIYADYLTAPDSAGHSPLHLAILSNIPSIFTTYTNNMMAALEGDWISSHQFILLMTQKNALGKTPYQQAAQSNRFIKNALCDMIESAYKHQLINKKQYITFVKTTADNLKQRKHDVHRSASFSAAAITPKNISAEPFTPKKSACV